MVADYMTVFWDIIISLCNSRVLAYFYPNRTKEFDSWTSASEICVWKATHRQWHLLVQRSFHLQPVLVAAMVRFLLCCHLALRPHLCLWGVGQKGQLVQGHTEVKQVCFRGRISILSWQREAAWAWVALYPKAGVISSVTLACLHASRQ